MKLLEILVEFTTELSSEFKVNLLWVSNDENNGLVQIALKDPELALINGFLR